jgi:hypothetical protein
MCLAVTPDEADSPLVIDPNTMLTSSISLKRLKSVARRNAKILQPDGGIKVEQFTPAHAFDGLKRWHRLVLEQGLRFAASKRPDQDLLYDAQGIPSNGMASGQDD